MKRILVDKNEGVAEVAEKILSEAEENIVLVLPRRAELGNSASNFHLLKREADTGGKHISLESVDEGLLALAKSSGIPASHPLLGIERRGLASPESRPGLDSSRRSGPLFSDIIPAQADDFRKPAAKTKLMLGKKAQRREDEPEEAKEVHYSANSPKKEAMPLKSSLQKETDKQKWRLPKWRFKKKFIVVLAAVVVILIGSVFVINHFWSRATVVINFNKTPWAYENNFVADTAVSKANSEKNILPGELFTLQKNLTQLFPASEVKQVSEKATGQLTIYNIYSSKPQTLVSATRFITPDGKIFRLQGQALVPGAGIKNGSVTPAHIEANVVADEAGPAYNVGPTPKLTIPGFKGRPQYKGFYGELKEGTKGGFVGKKAFPTADDIQKAKDKTKNILTASLETNFLNGYPPDFKILDGAKSFNLVKLNANENTDQNGNFSVFGEANLKALGFRESDVKSFLVAQSSRDYPNTVFKELNLQYDDIKFDAKNSRLSFKLTSRGILWPAFSADDLKDKILGQKIADVRSLVSGLPGLASAKVSLWPIWLGSVPSDPRKVTILAD